MAIKAFYVNRKGANVMRTVANAAEAEKILTGGYGAMEARLEDEDGTIVGKREKSDYIDDQRCKWIWWFERDVFAPTP